MPACSQTIPRQPWLGLAEKCYVAGTYSTQTHHLVLTQQVPCSDCSEVSHTFICLQEAGLLPDNFLGNHRTWLGFAKEQAGTAADNAQAGYNAASARAKGGYQKAKATIKDKTPEF